VIRIMVVEDHTLVREGVCALLEQQDDMTVVLSESNSEDALKALGEAKPDVAIVDICLPGINGIELTQEIVANSPQTKVIALSMHVNREMVLGVLSSGGSGYLAKECASDELVRGIRQVLEGERFFCAKAFDCFVKGHSEGDAMQLVPDLELLSPREKEVADLIRLGNDTAAISHKMDISISTANTHRRRIMKKFKAESLAKLMVLLLCGASAAD
jgi:two-component system response regulator NreC